MSKFWDFPCLIPVLGVGALVTGGIAVVEMMALANPVQDVRATEIAEGQRPDMRGDFETSHRMLTVREAADQAIRNAIALAGCVKDTLTP